LAVAATPVYGAAAEKRGRHFNAAVPKFAARALRAPSLRKAVVPMGMAASPPNPRLMIEKILRAKG
jgi:hypothetical protein